MSIDATLDGRDPHTDETLYQEGLTHLQAGEWAEAIRCFEALSPEAGTTSAVRQALEEARFKAHLEPKRAVRPKRWFLPWRMILVSGGIVIILVIIALAAITLLSRQAAPLWAQTQADRQVADLLKQGDAYLAGGKYDQAEASYQGVFKLRPDDPKVQAALMQLATVREVATLYDQGVTLQKAGDFAAAQQKFTDVALRKSDYKDTNLRITEITRQLDLDATWNRAEAAQAAGQCIDAVQGYQEVKVLNTNYKRDLLIQHLYECYMRLGREIIQREPPILEQVPKALEYFMQALALQPRSTEAITEQQLASVYLAGQVAFEAGRWEETTAAFSTLFGQRPSYLGGAYQKPLGAAYVTLGDSYRDQGDFALAWTQYHAASQLSQTDTVLARARMMSVQPMLTPTPTPTLTPMPTVAATPTPFVFPTPIAPPTPASPLGTYRNQILFWSDKEDQPGLWVMNPDGTNRRYLGNKGELRKQYDELMKKEALSSDGRYRVYTTTDRKDNNPMIYIQGEVNEWGTAPTWQVNVGFQETSYDPVWSPDGSRIAFVSQQRASDDVWVVNVDGKDPRNCTPNGWEWDKHPTWSPDSKRIVFWSNRNGLKQIYIMDADCRNVRRLSNTTWDDYDPLWVK